MARASSHPLHPHLLSPSRDDAKRIKGGVISPGRNSCLLLLLSGDANCSRHDFCMFSCHDQCIIETQGVLKFIPLERPRAPQNTQGPHDTSTALKQASHCNSLTETNPRPRHATTRAKYTKLESCHRARECVPLGRTSSRFQTLEETFQNFLSGDPDVTDSSSGNPAPDQVTRGTVQISNA